MSAELRFDRYRFEPESSRLWCDEQEVKLTPKAAAVLAALLKRAGSPVSKDELFATVWRGTVVSDDALVTCVQELRKALQDDVRHPRYIETRHRVGYRFIGSIETRSHATDTESAIAVLPFVDMSPDRDQDYFCEGLAEEIIDALTYVDGLRVAARSSSFQFRNPGLDVREVGRQLKADVLLEGSVRKAGDRLRVTVQLIDVASGYHKWSQRFDRTLGDVFAVQTEIAESVATTISGRPLSSREQRNLKRPQTDAEAYDYFLRGRQHLHRLQRADLEESRRLFKLAITQDAGYAPAWAGLATVHCILFEWWGANDEDLANADRISRIAMELAPELAEVHVARGLALSLIGRYDESAHHFERAETLNPQLFDAFYYHARMCFARGDIAASAKFFQAATEIRREDFQSPALLAQSLRQLGRKDEACAWNRESIARAERLLALNPNDVRVLSLGSGALEEDGQHERALEWSRRALEVNPDDMSALICAACLMAKIGNKEESLVLLERLFGRGWGKRDWIDHDSDYDVLRDDPRFQRLIAKLK